MLIQKKSEQKFTQNRNTPAEPTHTSNTDMLSQLFHKVNLNFVLLARRETDLCLTEYLLLRNLILVETNDFETI